MKIALVTDNFFPYVCGVCTVVESIYNALVEEGHDPYIVTYRLKDADYSNSKWNLVLIDGFLAPIPNAKKYEAYIPKNIAKAKEIISSYNFDLIHLNNDFTLEDIAIQVAKKQHIPLVHTWHTLWNQFMRMELPVVGPIVGNFATNILCRPKVLYADSYIVPSQKVSKYAKSIGIKKEPYVIPSGIDLEQFNNYEGDEEFEYELRKQYGFENKKIALYLGRVSKDKNLKYLIRLFAKVFPLRKDLVFLIVGEGPEVNYFKNYVKRLKLEDKILFYGVIDRLSTQKMYHSADLFVNASHMDTQGMTYVEALASKIPTLVLKDACFENVIIDGQTGFVFTEEKDFVTKLNYILDNDISKIVEAGFEKSKDYDKKLFASKIIKVYEETLKGYKK